MQKSIWEISGRKFDSLKEDCSCDVCIVGGGLTGVSLAYYLKDTSLKTILIEQNTLGHSTTARTTAKLTYLQQDIALKIKNKVGFQAARDYVYAQIDAINEVVRIIKKENISCHLEKNVSYLYVLEGKNIQKLENVYNLYKQFGLSPHYDKIPSFSTVRAFKVENTYVFHPLEYLYGLLESLEKKENMKIYEHTRMQKYKKIGNRYRVFLENGLTITCNQLVFANHYLPFVTPYFLPLKNYLEKSTVTAFPHENLYYNAINLDSDVCSVRFFEDYQILLKNSKRLSNAATQDKTKDDVPFLWHNYDLMTQTSLPFIGRIKRDENLYVATGYNTWGMTNSNIAARILASYIQGEKHPLAQTFASRYPLRILPFLCFLQDNFLQVIHFVGSYLPKKGKAKIVWYKGKRYGVYTDLQNKKHVVSLTCPHMKCGLRFNDAEKTWDCPCHGSKFDVDGNLIRGPATHCISRDTTS